MSASEYYVDPSKQTRTPVAISNATTTATVTQVGHGYTTGDTIKIHNAVESAYNGYWVIANVTTDTYDYTMSSDPGGSATGSPVASKMNLAGDDGSTDALAYADLQYAINTLTQNTADGDVIYIKRGTKEVLAEDLSFSSFTPSYQYPAAFIGYSQEKTDEGVAEIDFNGFDNPFGLYLLHRNIYYHNGGTNGITLWFANNCWVNGSGTVLLYHVAYKCVFTNNGSGSSYGIYGQATAKMRHCHIEPGGNPSHSLHYCDRDQITNCTYLIRPDVTSLPPRILNLGGYDYHSFSNNSLLNESSVSVKGVQGGSTSFGTPCAGNIYEGFSTAVEQLGTSEPKLYAGFDAFFDNTTNRGSETVLVDWAAETDDVLSESPYKKEGEIVLQDFYDNNATFWASREAYFATKDIGEVQSRGVFFPYKGAIEPTPINASPKHPLGRF